MLLLLIAIAGNSCCVSNQKLFGISVSRRVLPIVQPLRRPIGRP